MARSHQNALLCCYRGILQGEHGALCRGVANSIITLPSLPLWSETTQPAVLEPLLQYIVNGNLNHSGFDFKWFRLNHKLRRLHNVFCSKNGSENSVYGISVQLCVCVSNSIRF